jgi:hypothetical protein
MQKRLKFLFEDKGQDILSLIVEKNCKITRKDSIFSTIYYQAIGFGTKDGNEYFNFDDIDSDEEIYNPWYLYVKRTKTNAIIPLTINIFKYKIIAIKVIK